MNSIKFALFRRVPKSISNALTRDSTTKINAEKAIFQHEDYIKQLGSLVTNSVVLPELEKYPDCCFIEDTAVVIKPGVLVFTHPTAPSRQGEVSSVVDAIDLHYPSLKIYRMRWESDGGDVLAVENHLFVGNSTRSGPAAHQEWKTICQENDIKFHVIDVGDDALHLKSLVTYLGQDIGFMAANNQSSSKAIEQIKSCITEFEPTINQIAHPLGANMVRIENTVFYQDLLEAEVKYLTTVYNKITWKHLEMSELAKVDGALTCCSLLIK